MKTFRNFKVSKFFVALLTFVVIFIPYVFFLCYHFNFFLQSKLIVVSILDTFLGILTVILFIATSLSNPGYVKKIDPPYLIYDALKDTYRTTNPPRFVEMLINGYPTRVKYCITCHVYRPPRTVHCSECDRCVLKFDHHCPYVSNCIGYYNYKIFLSFVITCCIYYAFLLSSFIYRSVEFFPKFPSNVSKNPVDIIGTIIFMIICFLSIWVIFGLYFFHVFIIGKNMSTYDKLKEHFEEFNPFDRGPSNNCKSVFLFHRKRSRVRNSSIYNPYAMYSFDIQSKELGETQAF